MKYLDYKNQTAEEFNNILKEGIKTGIVLANKDDIKFMIELAYNLNYYITYFVHSYDLYEKENNNI